MNDVLQYLVLNDAGDEIEYDDLLTDRFGGMSRFTRVSRGAEYNGVAKVVVYDFVRGREHTYDATVFGLQVQTKCGVPNCGSVAHTTREHGADKRVGA